MRTDGSGIRGVRALFVGGGDAPGGAARGAAVRGLARSWRWGGLGLVLLCLAVYLPGLFSIPPVDRDESRFAMASWQMYTSGDWVVPRIQERPRLNKPPLIYWLQAGAWAVLGSERWENGGIWVFRLPSVGAAIATVLLTWRLGVRMFDPRAAWLGAALLAVCPMVVWDAHQARADQVLLTTVVGTQFALWVIWSGRGDARRRGGVVMPVLFWVWLALGVMTKGPITPMIAGLTALALSVVSREWRWLASLRPLMGVAIVVLLVGPWVYMVGERVGWSEYLGIVYDETLGRSAGAKEGHWGPPGYHTVLLGVLFWPGSLLTAAAIGRAFRRGLRRQSVASRRSPLPDGRGSDGGWLVRRVRALGGLRGARPAELFCLAWILPAWLVFELVSTKLPHYTMPMYPAIALLSARAVMVARAFLHSRRRNPMLMVGFATWVTVGALLISGIAGAMLLATGDGRDHVVTLDPLGAWTLGLAVFWIASMVLLVVMIVHLWARRILAAQLAGVGAAVMVAGVLLGAGLPRQPGFWISPAIVKRVEEARRARADDADDADALKVVSESYFEDSLVFLLRGRIRADRHGIGREQEYISIDPANAMELSEFPGECVAGFNYSKGRWEAYRIERTSMGSYIDTRPSP